MPKNTKKKKRSAPLQQGINKLFLQKVVQVEDDKEARMRVTEQIQVYWQGSAQLQPLLQSWTHQ